MHPRTGESHSCQQCDQFIIVCIYIPSTNSVVSNAEHAYTCRHMITRNQIGARRWTLHVMNSMASSEFESEGSRHNAQQCCAIRTWSASGRPQQQLQSGRRARRQARTRQSRPARWCRCRCGGTPPGRPRRHRRRRSAPSSPGSARAPRSTGQRPLRISCRCQQTRRSPGRRRPLRPAYYFARWGTITAFYPLERTGGAGAAVTPVSARPHRQGAQRQVHDHLLVRELVPVGGLYDAVKHQHAAERLGLQHAHVLHHPVSLRCDQGQAGGREGGREGGQERRGARSAGPREALHWRADRCCAAWLHQVLSDIC